MPPPRVSSTSTCVQPSASAVGTGIGSLSDASRYARPSYVDRRPGDDRHRRAGTQRGQQSRASRMARNTHRALRVDVRGEHGQRRRRGEHASTSSRFRRRDIVEQIAEVHDWPAEERAAEIDEVGGC